ncbi:MAG: hypothetical protein LCI00_26360 [Chloroflexi bacterium]|nr:hypothetical protein [Chloroflexota bacterium]MCC6892873.1 PD40 domain-containing protein [Anaerolineae bacterium]
MTRYLLRLSSFIGLAFGLVIGAAMSVGYLLPESLQMIYTHVSKMNKPAIFIQDVYRSVQRPLTRTFEFSLLASWSHDGTQIAYLAAIDKNFYIHIMDRYGHQKRRFELAVESIQSKLIWSPNNKHILLSFTNKNGSQSILMNAATGEYQGLQRSIGTGSWSSDSQNIRYYVFNELGSMQLYEMNIHCTTEAPVCEPKEIDLSNVGQFYGQLKLSPDEQSLTFSQKGEQNAKIMIAHLKCADLMADCIQRIDTLVDTPLDDAEPIWSPDGTQIAFVTSRVHLSIITVSTGELQTFDTPGIVPYLNGWSPDGQYIAYISEYTGIANVYLFNVKTGESQPLLADQVTAEFPEWRPMQP